MCDLCEREERTHHYYEDDLVWIVECESCQCPMAVIKTHHPEPTDRELEHLSTLHQWLFPDRAWDDEMRSIPDHYHVHFR